VSLRLRILLLIAAVNVAVLLLIIWLGLETSAQADLVGPRAIDEAFQIAHDDRPWEFPRSTVNYLVRLGGPGRGTDPEIIAPPEFQGEAHRMRERLEGLVQEGRAYSRLSRIGWTVVYSAKDVEWQAWHVGFNELASREGIRSLQTIYVLVSVGTVLLVLGTYLVLRALIFRPLHELVEASKGLAEGRPPEPVARRGGHDEMARLIDAFNLMAEEVHEYQQHLEERVMEALQRVTAAEKRLVVAQRLASTGTLAAGFAHEINNPLGGIVNALRKLRDGDLGPEKRQEYFQLINDGLDRISTIVERILHFTPRRREPASIDVAEVSRRAVALARHRAEARGVRMDLESDAHVRGVVGDNQELTQALLNLLLNAVDSIPEGRGGKIRVTVRREGAEVILDVADDGVGMAPETVARCVDFFFATKPEGEGTGLGLAIVQHIVTDHGGSLDIESEEGAGTTVRVRLPVEQAP
jgi:signal transduction histidine kinase